MAVGLLCISTCHTPGGARLLIQDHENRLLAPMSDAEGLVEKVEITHVMLPTVLIQAESSICGKLYQQDLQVNNMGIKHIIKKLIWGNKADPETYVDYLRSVGMSIGARVNIYEPRTVCIDETRPFMIKIGNDVKITRGVTILTHGYDWSVLAGIHNVVLGSAGGVIIGDNVFIGMNTTILKGVHIGNNVVIGAGSLVNKDIPDNCVAAGNPCRVIMSIDDYYEKRLKTQLDEAFEVYSNYVEAYGKEPPQEIFDEFFWLFHKRDAALPDAFKRQMSWSGKFDQVLDNLQRSVPLFNGYEEFLNAVRDKRNKG